MTGLHFQQLIPVVVRCRHLGHSHGLLDRFWFIREKEEPDDVVGLLRNLMEYSRKYSHSLSQGTNMSLLRFLDYLTTGIAIMGGSGMTFSCFEWRDCHP